MRSLIRFVTATLLVSLLSDPAAAMQVSTTDADTREVFAYRLTMPKLKQLNQFLTMLEADPANQQLLKKKKELEALYEKDELTEAEARRMEQLEAEIEAMEQEHDTGDDEDLSLGQIAARMEAIPQVAAALKTVGLTAREVATMQLAFFQAGFAASMLESGTIKEIPKEVNADNVKFLQANKAEITKLTALADRSNE